MPNYLGIDWGEKRIGLAFGDELGIATPLPAAVEPSRQKRMDHLCELVRTRRIDLLVVGYPLNMDGSAGFKAQEVDTFIAELERATGLPVRRVDERLTSREAERRSRIGGGGRRRSVQSQQRYRRSGELDSRAAALILQDFLNAEHGQPEIPWEEETS